VLRGVFEEFGAGKPVTPKFPLIPYAEAIRTYGTTSPTLLRCARGRGTAESMPRCVVGVGRQTKSDQHDHKGLLRGEKLKRRPDRSGVNVSAIAPRFGSDIVSHSTAARADAGQAAVKKAMRQP